MTSLRSAGEAITLEAHAKINAFLRVKRARPDGYHQISSLVLPITLSDTVRVEPSDGLKVDVVTDPPSDAGIGGINLALVAALALSEDCTSAAAGALIQITKRIPVAAGLGGGSADAASTLRALNQLWGCGLADADVSKIAERIGSDVPALMHEGPVLVSGRGEIVEAVSLPQFNWALLALDFQTRSPDAYRWWDEDGSTSGPQTNRLPDGVLAGDPTALAPLLSNDLQAPVAKRHPQVGAAVEAFMAAGALGSIMSGSGPTVVALAKDERHARQLASAIEGSIAVRSLGAP